MISHYIENLVPEISFGDYLLSEYVEALILFLGLSLLFGFLYWVILSYAKRMAEKSKNTMDDAVLDVVRSVKPPFYFFLALYLSLQTFSLPEWLSKALFVLLAVWIAHYGIVALATVLRFIVNRHLEGGVGEQDEATALFLVGLSKWIMWAVAILLILSNQGVEVTSLIAGLGIGGIAIAFALQNILGDLFSSLAIYFDKPFAVGDVIKVGDFIGEVVKVGIKTTRVKALSGEEVVFSNQDLTNSKIQNYGKMEERRIQFEFGVTYETNEEKLHIISGMVQRIIEKTKNTRFDRVHFKSFGDSALNYEVVYFVLSPDYNEYMDIQESINLELISQFRKKGIEFAYPTRTLYMAKNGGE